MLRRKRRVPCAVSHHPSFHDIRKGFEREPRIAHKPYGFVITAYFAAVHVYMGKHGIGGYSVHESVAFWSVRVPTSRMIGLLKDDGPLVASGGTRARGVGEHAERVPFVHAALAHHRGRHRQEKCS